MLSITYKKNKNTIIIGYNNFPIAFITFTMHGQIDVDDVRVITMVLKWYVIINE